MESKLRKNDEAMTEVISTLLDNVFYTKHTENFERVNDKKRQVSGIDVIFTYDGFEYVCDEKAAIHYINKVLPTFSLELSFIDRKDNLHDGWLIDEGKVNNSFLFVWIDKAKKDNVDSPSDVEKMEFALVRRDKIVGYLESLGWTKERLLQKTVNLRNNPREPRGDLERNGCRFNVSPQLVENPVNVLIKRDKLIELSDLKGNFE